MNTAVDLSSDAKKTEFYSRIDPSNLYPLWEAVKEMMTKGPQTEATPHLWKFDDIRPYVLEAGKLVSGEDAERRTLMLENPTMRGARRITEALYSGLQCIMPGEIAEPHRHSPSALRMVIESEGGYTSVNGETCDMVPGDLILNPSWHWHGHGQEGDKPHISMTCLDVPLVRFLGPVFAEAWTGNTVFPDGPPEGDCHARYGANMLPMNNRTQSLMSPIFRYSYEDTRDALIRLSMADEADPCHGIKMEYVNTTNAGPVLPTLSAFMQRLPEGFRGANYRSTAAWVYHAVEGSGQTVVGDKTLEWGPKDIFVIPAWYPHRHETDTDSFLFSFSDKGVHEKLGLFREQRGEDAIL
ncbi:MAG: cupin domain-containing protein [Pseudomonadota bacterium]|nr:cupin domain-containing protein [Pseudomonadota bacterium]